MKTVALVVFILFAFIGYALHAAAQGPVQALQTCGQGLVVRPDGSVLVEGWVSYSAGASPNATGAASVSTVALPTRITIGQAVADTMKVCVENTDGTICTTLGAVRQLAGASGPKR